MNNDFKKKETERKAQLAKHPIKPNHIENQVAANPLEKTANTATKIKHSGHLDPTRYGDWEKNGRCIDF